MTASAPNAAQIDYWNGDVGQRWARLQDRLDSLFSAITTIVVEAASARPRERVRDVGCGCGATVVALAKAVGEGGRVVGVDVSQVMLEVAARRIAADGLTQAGVTLADAATQAFDPSADLLVSRFGVMFFDDPVQAFANLRRALKPGGRLAFVCWRAMADNRFWTVPLAAARPFMDPAEDAPDPHAPGPFAFADGKRVAAILDAAGFSAIDIVPRDALLRLAGPGDVAEAAALLTQIGPVSRAMQAMEAPRKAAATAAIEAALRPVHTSEGVRLTAAVWLVTARA